MVIEGCKRMARDGRLGHSITLSVMASRSASASDTRPKPGRDRYMSAAQRGTHGTAQTCDNSCSEIKDGSQKKAQSIGNRVAIIPSNRVTRHTLISVVPDKPQSSVTPHIDIDKEPHHTPLGGRGVPIFSNAVWLSVWSWGWGCGLAS